MKVFLKVYSLEAACVFLCVCLLKLILFLYEKW